MRRLLGQKIQFFTTNFNLFSDAERHQKMDSSSEFWWHDECPDIYPDEEIARIELPVPPQSAPIQESPVEGLPEFPRRLGTQVGRSVGRVRGKAFFLTYSQSSIPRDVITQWFSRQIRMKRLIVGQEHHQDGNLHWHVLIEYEIEKDLRAGSYFNINNEHPNILVWQRVNPTGQTFDNWFKFHWDYCKKEDQTPYIVGEAPTGGRKRKRDDLFTEAIKMARTGGVNGAMKFLEDNAPYDLVTKYDQIGRALVKIRNISMQQQFPARALEAFPLAPEIVDDWHCLYINGKTGLGKTQWARALLPEATVVSHRNQLADCDFSKGVIFDDFEVSHWPPTAVIHLLDWDEPRGLDVKHGHVTIPAHTKKIFTTNCDFDRWVSKDSTESQIEACKRRVHVVNIYVRTF